MKNKCVSFYLSDSKNITKALELTGLALDELEKLVGYFNKNSHRAGKMRGELICDWNGVIIRHHFTKKVLWKSEQ